MPTIDARRLATAWLATIVAAGDKKASPVIGRTVHVADHDTGLRLTSTDGLLLLTTWVPKPGYELDPAPALDEAPDRSAIVRDPDARGSGLAAYLLSVVGPDPDDDDAIDLDVRFSFTALKPERDRAGELPGMGPQHVALDVPDLERVYLERLDGATFPAWARLLVGHEPRPASYIALNPDVTARVAKVGKLARSTVRVYFAGEDKPARLELPGPVVTVDGLVMPVRLELDPAPVDETAATPDNR